MPQEVALIPFGYTGRSISELQGSIIKLRGESCNFDTHSGELWASRGFRITRRVADSHSKPGGSWVHSHTDEGRTTFYYYDTALYPETGSDDPTAIATGLTQTWTPVVVQQAFPTGASAFLNGVNADAQLIREDGSNGLEAVPLEFPAPAGLTVSGSTSGGSLVDDTYYVYVSYVDIDPLGVRPSVESHYQAEEVIITGSSGNGSITIDVSTASPAIPARATHYRYYISNSTTAVSSALLEGTTAKGTTSATVQSLTGTTAIPNISNNAFTAEMPLDDVTCAVLHDGRMFIGSSKSNKVYFSVRGNLNEWNPLNEITTGAESEWSGGVVALISSNESLYVCTDNAIHRVWGDFSRDDQGDDATQQLRMQQGVLDTSITCVGPNAWCEVNGTAFIMSEQGLAAITVDGTTLFLPDDAQGLLDRIDWTYRDRIVLAEDPNGYVCILVPRLVNSDRPMDGASVAGVPDYILRFDHRHGLWAPPLRVGDITHIEKREDVAAGASKGRPLLMGFQMTGRAVQLGYGWSGGGPDDVSGTAYDGQSSTSTATTSVAYLESGITADDYNGMLVTLKYPDDDDNYPGLSVQKTVTDTAVAGSTVTLSWQGALTVPSGGGSWTVRVAGILQVFDVAVPSVNLPNAEHGRHTRLHSVRAYLPHIIGVESTD